jgi:hypothetical protein
VREAIAEAEPRKYTRRQPTSAPKLDPVKPIIDPMLRDDERARRSSGTRGHKSIGDSKPNTSRDARLYLRVELDAIAKNVASKVCAEIQSAPSCRV